MSPHHLRTSSAGPWYRDAVRKGRPKQGGHVLTGPRGPVITCAAMNVRRRFWTLAFAGALVLTLPAVTGCGPGSGDAKMANVQAGDLPAGGDWTGVWFSELYGYLHIVQDG